MYFVCRWFMLVLVWSNLKSSLGTLYILVSISIVKTLFLTCYKVSYHVEYHQCLLWSGMCSTTPDSSSPRVGRGSKHRPPQEWPTRHRKLAAPAIALASCQGRHRPHQEPCPLPCQPRPSQGGWSHTQTRTASYKSFPGHAEGKATSHTCTVLSFPVWF